VGLSFEPIDVLDLYPNGVEFWFREQRSVDAALKKQVHDLSKRARCAFWVCFGGPQIVFPDRAIHIQSCTGGPAHYVRALTLVIVANHHPMMDCTKD
jgi:hypothetical protein